MTFTDVRQAHPFGLRAALAAVLLGLAAMSAAQAQPASSRGALLYGNHCIECHNAKMHWRDARRAVDWATLRDQVGQWQARAMLGWSEADIDEVTRYLNDTIYHYTKPAATAHGARPGGFWHLMAQR